MDENTKIVALPEAKNLNKHQWTNEEKVFKQKDKLLQKFEKLNISFEAALLDKLSKSIFGPFLKELNLNQSQDNPINYNKLQILNWELKRCTSHDLNIINNRNIIFKDSYNLLKKAVDDCDVIDLSFLQTHLNNLSLRCCFIKDVDNSLQKFEILQVLSLSGNYIKDIAGSFLPRQLKFLELFDNFISDLKSLVSHAPKTIVHLGLGRNKLTNGSKLHLLSNNKRFKLLKSLDLSDNDICDLDSALNCLKEKTVLTAFSLEGNPCAVIQEYKNRVLMYFPKLQYLDFTEVLKEDIDNQSKIESENKLPQVMFQCHRILGLPEPPKDVKNQQVFYLEVNFPLLIENPIETEQKSINISDQEEIASKDNEETASKEKEKISKKGKDQKDKEGNHKTDKTLPLEQKTGKKKSYYAGADEYKKKFEKVNVWFKTERVSWSKIMEFAPIFINPPENNLKLIRDVFRSIVPVRLIYLKIAPFSNSKKPGKEKAQKDKNNKKTGKEKLATELENGTEEQQSETILKKLTLASFYCDLKSLNWSDNTLDFYWADHADIGEKALRVNGSLKAINYEIDQKQVNEKLQKSKEMIPVVLTIQVGFGLNR